VETLLTAVGFAAVTAVAVAFHVRRTSQGPSDCAPDRRACPRCGVTVPAKVKFCPGCGIPQQIFEVVGARTVAAAQPGGAMDSAQVHAVVRADVCVGCGACVPVCPEPGAIRLDGKLAVVDLARCKGHG
jgi:Pyruvate/2-oxoacid:ferredoxin oxidoreductase delta subunit